MSAVFSFLDKALLRVANRTQRDFMGFPIQYLTHPGDYIADLSATNFLVFVRKCLISARYPARIGWQTIELFIFRSSGYDSRKYLDSGA